MTFTAYPDHIDDATPEWDFGDTHHCFDCPPEVTHAYEQPGRYQVLLTATENVCYSAQVSYPQYIIVDPGPVLCPRPDGVCDPLIGETEGNCPNECGPYCSNGVCDAGEIGRCPLDCPTCSTVECAAGCAPLPTFDISNDQPTTADVVTFTAHGGALADPTPEWDFGDTHHCLDCAHVVNHRYELPGTYQVQLTARESVCYSTQTSIPRRVTVSAAPMPPAPVFCPHPNGVCELELGENQAVCPEDCEPGCGNGDCQAGEHRRCPGDCEDTPSLSLSAGGPYVGLVGVPLLFQATATLNDGEQPIEYRWHFGDGATSVGQQASHIYDADGRFIVTVVLTTNYGITSATSVATVSFEEGANSSSLKCEHDCEHDEEFRFDSARNLLIASAYLRINPGTDDATRYHPVLRVIIKNPSNLVMVDTTQDAYEKDGRVDQITADLRGFNGFNPSAGRWRFHVEYYYRRIEEVTSPLQLQGLIDISAEVFGCDNGPCDINPDKTKIVDGHSGTFTLVNPRSDRTYYWDWRFSFITSGAWAPSGPQANLSPQQGTQTTALRPTWVAHPNVPNSCNHQQRLDQALNNSEYSVILRDTSPTPRLADARFTVTVPWGFDPDHSFPSKGGLAAAGIDRPELRMVQPDLAVVCNATQCTVDPERLEITRKEPGIAMRASLTPGSVFYRRLWEHENDHKQFWMDPARCGYRYFQPEGLKQAVVKCVADGKCVANIVAGGEKKARFDVSRALWKVRDDYQQREDRAADAVHDMTERQAWDVSETVPPHFLYSRCGNYAGNYSCPRP